MYTTNYITGKTTFQKWKGNEDIAKLKKTTGSLSLPDLSVTNTEGSSSAWIERILDSDSVLYKETAAAKVTTQVNIVFKNINVFFVNRFHGYSTYKNTICENNRIKWVGNGDT